MRDKESLVRRPIAALAVNYIFFASTICKLLERDLLREISMGNVLRILPSLMRICPVAGRKSTDACKLRYLEPCLGVQDTGPV